MRLGRGEHRLLQRVALRVPGHPESGGEHDRGFGAARTELADQARHRRGRRADDRELRHRRQARHGRVGLEPASPPCLGLTGMMGPANFPSTRLRRTVAPTLCGVSDAPMTAMDRGRNRCSRFLMLIVGLRRKDQDLPRVSRGAAPRARTPRRSQWISTTGMCAKCRTRVVTDPKPCSRALSCRAYPCRSCCYRIVWPDR